MHVVLLRIVWNVKLTECRVDGEMKMTLICTESPSPSENKLQKVNHINACQLTLSNRKCLEHTCSI